MARSSGLYPSFFAMAISGFLILFVIILMVFRINEVDHFNKYFQTYMLLLTLAIAVGVHGIQHAYSEVNYNYNPLKNEWDYKLLRDKINQNNQRGE